MSTFGIWIGAILTLGILSFLYKDNPFYKLSEAIFLGISAGYWFVSLFWQNLVPKAGWISRWPLAFVVGTTSGVYLTRYLASNALAQINNTLKDFIVIGQPGFLSGLNVNYLLVLLGVLSGLTYFYFSMEHKGVTGGAAKIGIYFLMVTFGASFGYTVMSRMSLLIGRLDFLYGDWLHLIR